MKKFVVVLLFVTMALSVLVGCAVEPTIEAPATEAPDAEAPATEAPVAEEPAAPTRYPIITIALGNDPVDLSRLNRNVL